MRVSRVCWCESIGNMGQDSKLFIRGALDLKEEIESVSNSIPIRQYKKVLPLNCHYAFIRINLLTTYTVLFAATRN